MAVKARLLSWLLRIVVAAVFVLSAVSKMAGIDQFEVYVYSFGFLPLNVCFILARLCIGLELVLALMILAGWYPRLTRLATLGTLLFFSLFLCYAALVGRNDSCQCFGQWVQMDPIQSLLKNAVLILLVIWHFHLRPKPLFPPKWWLLAPGLLAALVMPFVVSVPDNWAFGKQRLPYNETYLDTALQPGQPLEVRGLGNDRRVVAFVTQRCPYCKIAREKLDGIVSRHGIDPSRIVYILPSDITHELFISITHGARPLVMLLDGREVVATYHSRNIDEREIASFFKE